MPKNITIGLDPMRFRMLEAMRYIMFKKNITAKAFAEAIGSTETAIQRWKNKTTHPTALEIINVCQVFKIPPAWLLLGEGTIDGKMLPNEWEERIKALEKAVFKK